MDGHRRQIAVLLIVCAIAVTAYGQAQPPPQGQGVGVNALVERINALEVQVTGMRGDISTLRASVFRTVATKSTQEVFAIVCFLISYDGLKYIIRRWSTVRILGSARRRQDERVSQLDAEFEAQLKAERLRRIAIEDTLTSLSEVNKQALGVSTNLAALDGAMRGIVGDKWVPVLKQVPTQQKPPERETKRQVPSWAARILLVIAAGASLITYISLTQ